MYFITNLKKIHLRRLSYNNVEYRNKGGLSS